MKKDEPGKTRKFIKRGLILWLIVIGVFRVIEISVENLGDLYDKNSQSGFFEQLNGIIFIFGVCGIPLILLLSIALKLAERTIEKL